jgi:hypothetical protein
MRTILLIILAYLIFRSIKPLLQKKPENPHVKGENETKDRLKNNRNIEDADFEEIE